MLPRHSEIAGVDKKSNGGQRALSHLVSVLGLSDAASQAAPLLQQEPLAAFDHPLDPLSVEEIREVSAACKAYAAEQGLHSLRFNTITLQEPPKAAQLAYEAGRAGPPPRQAFAIIQVPDPGCGYVLEGVVTLGGEAIVVSWKKVDGVQPMVTVDDCIEAEIIFKEDAGVQKVVRERYGIANIEDIACDPWYYGERYIPAGKEPYGGRIIQCFLYTRTPGMQEDNHYAHPLDLVVYLDVNTRKVIDMWMQDTDAYKIPLLNVNYHRDLIEKPWRQSPKPLNVQMPEGPSFELQGNLVTWQKWHMRVGFNYREGLVLHNVGYEDGGRVRPVLQRASTVEIIVPYADPREPFNRKCAYDAMDYGLGVCSNSLELGCDCLGFIKYFDGVLTDANGDGMVIKKAICMHEEDAGILWKHTEYRTNHMETRRARRLVLSFIATIANYEYGFFWYFYQDGTIQHEVKLTGILSTNGLSAGEGPHPEYGVLMAPHLNAQIHQHFFCVRLDMACDCPNGGDALTLTETNCETMPAGPDNPFGVGFLAKETVLRTEHEAQRSADFTRSRVWKIKNTNVINPLNGQPVAWKLAPAPAPPLYAHESSSHATRGIFATKHLWATPHSDDQLYPAGMYPLEPNPQGIKEWTAKNRSIEKKDLVLYYNFGVTHIPRVEDWPVMPVEHASFHLKPVNFFDGNPGIDLAPIYNGASVEVTENGNGLGANCCKASAGGHGKDTPQLVRHTCCGRSASACTCIDACTCKAGRPAASGAASRL